jgi:mannose-6-phosphate isomerase
MPDGPLPQAARRARAWLLEAAAPLWSTRGRMPSGLFAERMSLAGEPDPAYFRCFVQARHIYAFVVAGTLGWEGPWRDLVSRTADVLVGRGRRDDGFYVHRLDGEAVHLDARADLYDQAFILFALGTAGRALGRDDLFDRAEDLLDRLEGAWRHPAGGFREGEIADPRVRRQNPHMHLLEAFLALYEASGRERFRAAATDIAALADNNFIDPETGALLEYFADDLTPAPGQEGRIVEPGHCFEWAWLFERLAATGWQRGAELSDRLTAFARRHGIDTVRGVVVNAVLTDGAMHDQTARLWPQTERIKAAVARLRRLGTEEEAREVAAAAIGLERYFDVPMPGLWRDKLTAADTWIEEPAPGSSLYHITCAYAELAECGRP